MKTNIKVYPLTEEFKSIETEPVYSGGVYLHGQLETLCGYDLIKTANCIELGLTLQTIAGDKLRHHLYIAGRYPVECAGINEPCWGFFWHTSLRMIIHEGVAYAEWKQRGLICLQSDIEACNDAITKMLARETII